MVRFNKELEHVLARAAANASTDGNVFHRDSHGQLWMKYDAMLISAHTLNPSMTVLSYYYLGKHVVSLDLPGSIGPNSLVLKGVNGQLAIDEAHVSEHQPPASAARH